MDRTELERRMRQRRIEGPFHRGDDERDGGARAAGGRIGGFVPEPADDLARQEPSAPDEQPRVDYFDERAARRAGEDQAWGSAPKAFVPPGAGGIPGAALRAGQVDWPSRDLAEEDANEPIPPGEQVSRSSVDEPGEPGAGAALAGGALAGEAALGHESVAEAPIAPRPYQPATPYVPEHTYHAGYPEPAEPPYRATHAYQAGPPYTTGDDDGGGGDEPGWAGYDEPPRRGSGALPIVGFLVLGLAALLGGAFLFAAMNVPARLSQSLASSSPTSSPTAAGETASPTENATASQASTPTAAPPANKFSAKVEPCASSKMGFSGCAEDGTRLSGNQVWVWVGFKNGRASTVIGITIVSQATKTAVGDGSVELDQVGCAPGETCAGGYVTMTFGNLDPGKYEIQVTGDGDPAASTSFTVTG
jgi:hypothetical protein